MKVFKASLPGVGQSYHVLEEARGLSSQIHAFEPGSGKGPKQVQRYFTLVKANCLDSDKLSALAKPEQPAKNAKKETTVGIKCFIAMCTQ